MSNNSDKALTFNNSTKLQYDKKYEIYNVIVSD